MKSPRRIAGKASFLVACPEHHGRNLRPANGTRTHGAWFNRYVECAACQVFSSKDTGGGCYRQHFRVRRYVIEPFRLIVCSRNDTVATNYYRSDGNLTFFVSIPRFIQSLPHEIGIVKRGNHRRISFSLNNVG